MNQEDLFIEEVDALQNAGNEVPGNDNHAPLTPGYHEPEITEEYVASDQHVVANRAPGTRIMRHDGLTLAEKKHLFFISMTRAWTEARQLMNTGFHAWR
ncbi:hypothetical protein FHETE_10620 [Fusarium heterosporum]|uniref:Uncharacterized protein n=1 Tax=Fusarium heterosporum TaxID=42747 RepID=A0A8H5WG14_FUSHE|nr:hypothetical protein FHETE_10620 [Fusarium heterosporum]